MKKQEKHVFFVAAIGTVAECHKPILEGKRTKIDFDIFCNNLKTMVSFDVFSEGQGKAFPDVEKDNEIIIDTTIRSSEKKLIRVLEDKNPLYVHKKDIREAINYLIGKIRKAGGDDESIKTFAAKLFAKMLRIVQLMERVPEFHLQWCNQAEGKRLENELKNTMRSLESQFKFDFSYFTFVEYDREGKI